MLGNIALFINPSFAFRDPSDYWDSESDSDEEEQASAAKKVRDCLCIGG